MFLLQPNHFLPAQRVVKHLHRWAMVLALRLDPLAPVAVLFSMDLGMFVRIVLCTKSRQIVQVHCTVQNFKLRRRWSPREKWGRPAIAVTTAQGTTPPPFAQVSLVFFALCTFNFVVVNVCGVLNGVVYTVFGSVQFDQLFVFFVRRLGCKATPQMVGCSLADRCIGSHLLVMLNRLKRGLVPIVHRFADPKKRQAYLCRP